MLFREWIDDSGEPIVQKASANPSTPQDAINLSKNLDEKLKVKNAKVAGVCPIRRQLFEQCFDELIRQVTREGVGVDGGGREQCK